MDRRLREGSSYVLCWIYLLHNSQNTKVYIGQTWMPLKARWDSTGYKGCTHLYNAIQKYGDDAFHYEVLTVAHTQEMANYWEDYFVKQFDARNPEKGYNIKEAGSSGKHSEESKAKIGASLKGRVHSEEHRQKRSDALKGRRPSDETIAASVVANTGNTYWVGKTHSQETKDKLSVINTGKVMSQEIKDKISAANTGMVMPRSAVEKSAASRRGAKRSDEARARIKAGMQNRAPDSLETRAKKTAAVQKRELERLQLPEVHAQHRLIEAMYIAGDKYEDIMAAAKCSESLVTKVVKRAGIPLRGVSKPALGAEMDAKIAIMYRDELRTANEIAKIVDFPPHTVRKSLREQGIELRKGGFQPKSVNP